MQYKFIPYVYINLEKVTRRFRFKYTSYIAFTEENEVLKIACVHANRNMNYVRASVPWYGQYARWSHAKSVDSRGAQQQHSTKE